MKKLIAAFLERSRTQQVVIIAAAYLLIVGGVFYFLFAPVQEQVARREAEVADLTTKVTDLQRRARNIVKLREELAQLDEKFVEASAQLPDVKAIPELLNSIEKIAADVGIEVTLFQRQADVRRDFYADVPVQIVAEGSYHQLLTFFDEVTRLPRIVNLTDISVTNPSFSESKLIRGDVPPDFVMPVQVRLRATTFRFLTEEERALQRAEAEAAKSKKSKRRR